MKEVTTLCGERTWNMFYRKINENEQVGSATGHQQQVSGSGSCVYYVMNSFEEQFNTVLQTNGPHTR